MPDKRIVVSSAHLASENGASLSEYEFGLTIAHNAFNRWMQHCASAAGEKDLSCLEILVVHHINHRERAKRLADICFVLNIEDAHTVNYSLKKLIKKGLVGSEKVGKEMFYRSTEQGAQFCERYRDVREDCLVDFLSSFKLTPEQLSDYADSLRTLAGLYDQASRAAASL